MSQEWKNLENEAAVKLGEIMSLIQKRRWSRATKAERNKQGQLMRSAKARKAKKGKKP